MTREQFIQRSTPTSGVQFANKLLAEALGVELDERKFVDQHDKDGSFGQLYELIAMVYELRGMVWDPEEEAWVQKP